MAFSKFKPSKTKSISLKHFGGRNNLGRITVRHQGGGHKRLYRKINWMRDYSEGIVSNFEYDPNRSAYLAKLYHKEKKSEGEAFSYIIAPKGVKIFDKLSTINERKKNILLKTGDTSILANFEFGDFLHNVENIPGKGALFARSAGTYCQVLQQNLTNCLRLKLPSGQQRLVPLNSKATLGIVANENHMLRVIGKAGRSRWLNKRPSVRGVAMNPVDHPHGGGQGKTKGGRPSVTPWSWPTKGQPTRNPRKKNKFLLTLKKN